MSLIWRNFGEIASNKKFSTRKGKKILKMLVDLHLLASKKAPRRYRSTRLKTSIDNRKNYSLTKTFPSKQRNHENIFPQKINFILSCQIEASKQDSEVEPTCNSIVVESKKVPRIFVYDTCYRKCTKKQTAVCKNLPKREKS